MMLGYVLVFGLCFFVVYAQDGCGGSTTQAPDQQPCRRDIIIAVDGTNFMKNETFVLEEIDFIDKMISNWTWGDDGVNVAFVNYGFLGQLGFSQFFPDLEDAKQFLGSFRTLASNGIFKATSLTGAVQFVDQSYTNLYPHRPGIEPRFIIFTSTPNTSDIATSSSYFQNLYAKNYETLINVVFANPSLYNNVEALKIINMKAFLPEYYQNITETIWNTLCVHDIRFTPLPCTTTTTTIPPSTTTTTTAPPATTMTTTPPLPAPTTTSPNNGPPVDGGSGQCRCVTHHLWLDIVIVMDASKSITNEGIGQLRAHILTLFGEYMTIDPLKKQSVRVAIISTAERAKIEANFDDIKSLEDLEDALYGVEWRQNENSINIEEALQNASTIILDKGPQRKNLKKVIIVYTSAFDLDGFSNPVAVADQLKSSGVTIIGVRYNLVDESEFNANLSLITSPNMTFSNKFVYNPFQSPLLNITVDALCWVNCFCINEWNQRKNAFTSFPEYGQCFYPADIDSGWSPARRGCSDFIQGSSMSFAKTKDKFDYFLDMFANQTSKSGKLNFHVGVFFNQTLNSYQYVDGSLVALPTDYFPWTSGFPKLSSGDCIAANQGGGFSVTYKNVDCYSYYARYVCEIIPCDTENYCENIDGF